MRNQQFATKMQNLCRKVSLSHFRSRTPYCKPSYSPFLCFFSSASSLTHSRTSTPTSNPSLSNFLIETLALSEPLSVSISNRFHPKKTIGNPHAVVQFLKQLGFSDAHVRSTIRTRPKTLSSNIDKTLKPKLQFFQDLGLTGPDLGKFISTHSRVLVSSLERTLIPFVDIIKNTLINDENNQGLIRVLQCPYWATSKSELRLKCNIAFLESCGIVGSQLSNLLKRQPWLFLMNEPALRDLVSRVFDMGFSVDSKMLVHAVYAVSSLSGVTFDRKIELFRSFGFSEDECMIMFRRAPMLLGVSKGKLKLGMEFFLYDIKLERSALVSSPSCLMYSMGERILPRYRVLQVLKCKTLLKKEPGMVHILKFSEEKFLEKFISRFRDDAEKLLVAYKGNPLDS